MSEARPVRVGMIGCGGNARSHMQQLKQIPGVQIVALTDPSPKALEETVRAHPELAGVPQFSDHRQMLAQVDMDAVEISTPHTLHFQQIMDALDAGKHVLCEKPMVCSTQEALQVIEKVRATGLVMGIAYQRHFMGPYRYCRQRIQSGALGRVNFICALQSQNWYRAQVPRRTWRSQKALSGGGQLNDSGSHLLDIVLWMTNLTPRRVFALENNLDAEVDILTAMSVEFEGGALCNLSVVGHSVNWLEDITLWCEEGTLAIRGAEVHEWMGGEQRVVHPPQELPGFGNPDLNFIAAVRGEEQIQAPPECGLQVMRLTEAAWQSAATGEPVEVRPLP
jgi:predicted dehydrogenase